MRTTVNHKIHGPSLISVNHSSTQESERNSILILTDHEYTEEFRTVSKAHKSNYFSCPVINQNVYYNKVESKLEFNIKTKRAIFVWYILFCVVYFRAHITQNRMSEVGKVEHQRQTNSINSY